MNWIYVLNHLFSKYFTINELNPYLNEYKRITDENEVITVMMAEASTTMLSGRENFPPLIFSTLTTEWRMQVFLSAPKSAAGSVSCHLF